MLTGLRRLCGILTRSIARPDLWRGSFVDFGLSLLTADGSLHFPGPQAAVPESKDFMHACFSEFAGGSMEPSDGAFKDFGAR